MTNWFDTFRPFSGLHVACVLTSFAFVWTVVAYARSLRDVDPQRERTLRRWLGVAAVCVQSVLVLYYAWPSRFTLAKGLPLEICDLLGFVTIGVFLTERRWLRTLAVFWGIGFSTQAFATPTIDVGIGHERFWIFWASHAMIVLGAVYCLLVLDYRPTFRDFLLVSAAGVVYPAFVLPFDIAFDLNYGFIGRSKPEVPTLLDQLGEWPLRAVWIFLLQQTVMAVLWLLLRDRGRRLR
jgi:hypothetical integral membrane protein (TIGR02206 family)